ncbi:MAG: hypothetical protein WD646_15400 [Actinomycetota bacterium]
MRRHAFDVLSFVFGLVFLAASGLLSARDVDLYGPGLRWIAIGGLMLLGLGMLIGSRTRSEDRR